MLELMETETECDELAMLREFEAERSELFSDETDTLDDSDETTEILDCVDDAEEMETDNSLLWVLDLDEMLTETEELAELEAGFEAEALAVG